MSAMSCAELVRTTDWSTTPIGPRTGWPQSLETIVQVILHSRHPMFLWWGPELVQIYNDAYVPSFGVGKHPAAMGQRGVECWQEIWPIIWPQIEDVMQKAKPSWNEDQLVPIFRNGRIEEVYWTYGYSPVFLESGDVGGTLVVCTETTARVVSERRLRILRDLANRTAQAITPDQVFSAAQEVVARAERDIPFSIFYGPRSDTGPPNRLATIGIEPEMFPAIEASLEKNIAPEHGGFLSIEALARDGFFSQLEEPGTGRVLGSILFGLNPQLPFDDAYREFLVQLCEHVVSARSRIDAFVIRAAAESARRNLLLQAPLATALLVGPEHRFELANDRYREMVGRDVVGKTYREAFPELSGEPIFEILDRVYREGQPFVTNELLLPIDRSRLGQPEDCYFKFNLEPLRDESNHIYGMMAVAVDITELVEARRVLEKVNAERELLLRDLEAASRAKDEFLAMLGHELRNPLSPIVTGLQLMKLRGGGKQSKEEEVMERQVTHLVRLVDDLLDISKITRGKIELRKETVEVAEVLRESVEMASVLLEQREHELHLEVPPAGLAWHGDRVRLAQVVANLLTNAARYTEVGGRIVLAAQRDGEVIVIRVCDNGMGIAPEMLPQVFDMFVQAKRSADRAEGGLGLGLTLVKTLVALHGGTVSAHSDGLGKGSEFVIRLPAARADQPKAVEPPDEKREVSLPSRRVLVVDDNVDAAELLGEALRAEGHQVTTAHDPLTALEELGELDPEVAILDIGLPVMDGYALAAKVRQSSPRCRLIALTGYGQEHDVARAEAAGFHVHLVKPVNLRELRERIAHPAGDRGAEAAGDL